MILLSVDLKKSCGLIFHMLLLSMKGFGLWCPSQFFACSGYSLCFVPVFHAWAFVWEGRESGFLWFQGLRVCLQRQRLDAETVMVK